MNPIAVLALTGTWLVLFVSALIYGDKALRKAGIELRGSIVRSRFR